MMLALGLATAGVTRSPEHAQVTTLPLSLGIIAVVSWVGITGTEELGLLKRLLPGGSAAELVIDSWNGGVPRVDSLLLLAPTVVWVGLAIALAPPMFRLEPRAASVALRPPRPAPAGTYRPPRAPPPKPP